MNNLADTIRKRIERGNGRISFAEFMGLALYDKDFGYYSGGRRVVWGVKGDYVTTVDMGPILGQMLAKQFFQMWELLGRPGRFHLVEAGAGRGLLTDSVLAAIRARYGEFYSSLRVYCVETNKSMHREANESISWHSELCEIDGPFEGCIYSNELLDALPFHRVVCREGELKEIFVGFNGQTFAESEAEISDKRLIRYFEAIGVQLVNGQKAEVSLNTSDWIKNAASLLKRGYVVTIDYGMPAAELYRNDRPGGTLLCHYKHTVNDSPYERVGEQDITAHVDFTSVRNAGMDMGLRADGYVSQREFLLSLGVLEELRELSGLRPPVEDIIRNQHIKAVVMPGGISDVMKVFVQSRNAPKADLLGFSGKNDLQKL